MVEKRHLVCATLVLLALVTAVHADLPPTGMIPLPDMGTSTYDGYGSNYLDPGYAGGLYPNGSNQRPAGVLDDALDIAQNQIAPLDTAGYVDQTNGRIVMISIGMSNVTQEFSAFVSLANNDPAKSSRVELIDCAISSMTADRWANINDSITWPTAMSRISSRGCSAQQVQVAWIKQAIMGPASQGAFPAHAEYLQGLLEQVARNLKLYFPNIKFLYCSSRTRAHVLVNENPLNPEPYAYESAWSVKWMIEKQINGEGNLNWDPAVGTVVAPMMLWGPYLWADGSSPRSDGLVWLTSDVISDGTHPSFEGRAKVAAQLKAFFKTDPTSRGWFLKDNVTGQAPTLSIAADRLSAEPGSTINFSAIGTDPDGPIAEYEWTFDDGCYSTEQNPSKTFPTEGTYEVRCTATDNLGNAVTEIKIIEINDQWPVPVIETDLDYGLAPLTVNFDATTSQPFNTPIVSYEWDFGDTGTDTGSQVAHTFTSDGDYVVTLTVTDEEELQGVCEKLIHVGPLDVSTIGDLNADEVVDFGDVAELGKYWHTGELMVDIVSDGYIDYDDLAAISDHWLFGAPYPHQDPMAWYKLDGNATDSSGFDHDGLIRPEAVYGTGYDDTTEGALVLDGVYDWIKIDSSSHFDMPQGTWCLWFRTNGNWGVDGDSGGTGGRGSACLITRHNAAASREGLNFFINPNGYLVAQAKNASSKILDVTGQTIVTDNQWHHAAVVYDGANGATVTIYLDGLPNGSSTNSAAWSFNDQDILIGDSADDYWEEFAGRMDDIRIYNRLLDPQEIADLAGL